MRKLLSWIITPFYLVIFVFTMVFWHPLIALSFYVNRRLYLQTIALGNGLLLLELRLLGTRISVQGLEHLPRQKPLIIASNHQSLFDIPLLLWTLRSYGPCFIAKRELGKNIPSISHALRNMGSALIDRGDARAAIRTIEDLGTRVQQNREAAIIFPEGTRARNGRIKPFKSQGIMALLRTMPDAEIVPTVISGSWRLTYHNFAPVPIGVRISLTFLPPLKASSPEAAPGEVQALIEAALPIDERRAS
jgi:1-acyl-sn-glycerol-3-phosphate acyltransferase